MLNVIVLVTHVNKVLGIHRDIEKIIYVYITWHSTHVSRASCGTNLRFWTNGFLYGREFKPAVIPSRTVGG